MSGGTGNLVVAQAPCHKAEAGSGILVGPDGMQGNPEIRKWSRIVNHSTPWIPYHTSDPALEQKPKLPITRDKFGSFTITPYEPKIFEHGAELGRSASIYWQRKG